VGNPAADTGKGTQGRRVLEGLGAGRWPSRAELRRMLGLLPSAVLMSLAGVTWGSWIAWSVSARLACGCLDGVIRNGLATLRRVEVAEALLCERLTAAL
jgi:hypothetical protein